MGSCDHGQDSSIFATDGEYSISNVAMGVSRPLRLICVGAGASGLNLIYQTRAHMQGVDLVVYEKNDDVGGTWYENR